MNEGSQPILYSFRRCPYAMRARMALYTSGVRCELREVVLRDKPTHMLEISPKATVPVLQVTPDQIIDESLDVMLWALDQHDPDQWLVPENNDPGTMMALIAKADGDFKDNLDRYKYSNRYEGVDAAACRTAGEGFLVELNTMLQNTPYLFGQRPCLADMAIATFIRQFANTDRDWFDQTPYVPLHGWLSAFLDSESFNAVMDKYPQWQPDDPITGSPVAF